MYSSLDGPTNYYKENVEERPRKDINLTDTCFVPNDEDYRTP